MRGLRPLGMVGWHIFDCLVDWLTSLWLHCILPMDSESLSVTTTGSRADKKTSENTCQYSKLYLKQKIPNILCVIDSGVLLCYWTLESWLSWVLFSLFPKRSVGGGWWVGGRAVRRKRISQTVVLHPPPPSSLGHQWWFSFLSPNPPRIIPLIRKGRL